MTWSATIYRARGRRRGDFLKAPQTRTLACFFFVGVGGAGDVLFFLGSKAGTMKVLQDALRLVVQFAEKQMSLRSTKNDYCPKEDTAAIEATKTIKEKYRQQL